jgi:hypothetical protein
MNASPLLLLRLPFSMDLSIISHCQFLLMLFDTEHIDMDLTVKLGNLQSCGMWHRVLRHLSPMFSRVSAAFVFRAEGSRYCQDHVDKSLEKMPCNRHEWKYLSKILIVSCCERNPWFEFQNWLSCYITSSSQTSVTHSKLHYPSNIEACLVVILWRMQLLVI